MATAYSSTTATPLTADQAATMQAQLNAYNATVAAQAAADRAAKLKPLTDLLASDAWTQFRAQIGPAATASIGETFYDTVRALDQISGNLPRLAGIPTATAA